MLQSGGPLAGEVVEFTRGVQCMLGQTDPESDHSWPELGYTFGRMGISSDRVLRRQSRPPTRRRLEHNRPPDPANSGMAKEGMQVGHERHFGGTEQSEVAFPAALELGNRKDRIVELIPESFRADAGPEIPEQIPSVSAGPDQEAHDQTVEEAVRTKSTSADTERHRTWRSAPKEVRVAIRRLHHMVDDTPKRSHRSTLARSTIAILAHINISDTSITIATATTTTTRIKFTIAMAVAMAMAMTMATTITQSTVVYRMCSVYPWSSFWSGPNFRFGFEFPAGGPTCLPRIVV